MRKTLILTAAAACLATAFSAQANLVMDPNFASSGLSDWTVNIGTLTSVTSPVYGTSGTAGKLGVSTASFDTADISQVVLPTGSSEMLSFYAYVTAGGVLSVTLDDTLVIDNGVNATGNWEYFSFLVASPTDTTSDTLDIDWNSAGKGSLYLDDVSVSAVPEASTVFAGALLLLPLGASTLRVLRKNRTA